MRPASPVPAGALFLTGCSRLVSIPHRPPQTADTWLRIQPFVEVRLGSDTIVLVQPTTTAIVYLLGLVGIAAGLYFLRIRGPQRSRLWWGIALVFWGAGALAAGTSYEAFSWHIKCAGREACAWTSWWEIWYLVLTMASVDAIVMAQSYTSAAGGQRTALARYAIAHCALYTLMVAVGAAIPARFLISFEMLLVASVPSAVICVGLSVSRYRTMHRDLERTMLGAWTWMALTIAGYYLYLASGATQALWARGIWFSENDVLHVGLILWMIYLTRVVARHVFDEPGVAEQERLAVRA